MLKVMIQKEWQLTGRSLVILVIVTLAILATVGCGSGQDVSKATGTPSSAVEAKKSPTLPPPSSLKSDEDEIMVITSEELVKGISKNSTKENIKEYFGKYADITGDVKGVGKDQNGKAIELVLEGYNGEAELAYIMCVITEYDQSEIDNISEGQSITVNGKITAMSEQPGTGMTSFFTEKNFQGQVIKNCKIK